MEIFALFFIFFLTLSLIAIVAIRGMLYYSSTRKKVAQVISNNYIVENVEKRKKDHLTVIK